MTSFFLKIIACICMIFDHSGYLIFGTSSWFNYIGRLAFPIFAFQISEGYIHTRNLKKYFFRLIVFAIISQIPFILFSYFAFNSFSTLNIFFTLALGLLAIIIIDKMPIKLFGIILAILIGYLADFLHTDYGSFGIAIIVIFYLFKNNIFLMDLSYIVAVVLKFCLYMPDSFKARIYCFFTILPIILINLYNKEQGKKIKYFLYIFYPAHLLILSILLYFSKQII